MVWTTLWWALQTWLGGVKVSDLQVAYSFRVPAARRLASLMGLRSDMERVIAYCDLMIARYAGPHLKKDAFDIVGFTTPLNFDDWDALSTAACIAYARCFTTGVRERLDTSLLSSASAEDRALHEFVCALRDKHIAHSVNSFENNVITVHVMEHFKSSQEIETVGVSQTWSCGFSFDQPAKLKCLAQWWVANADTELAAERAKVLEIARATPLSDIKAFGVPTPAQPRAAGNVAKKRKTP